MSGKAEWLGLEKKWKRGLGTAFKNMRLLGIGEK